MLTVTINDKKYGLPQNHSEVSLKEFKGIQDFLYSEHNEKRTERVLEGKVTKKNEEDTLQFFIEFINFVTNIPIKELKKVRRFTSDDEQGIEDIFYSMSFLFVMPNIEEPKPMNRVLDYYFIDKIDLNQAILKDLSTVEYTEANAVINAFNQLKKGRYEYLNLLLAIMYRPRTKKWYQRKYKFEEYDSDIIKERAKEFDSLNMNVVWNCLFFFTSLKLKSLKSITKSLEAQAKKELEIQG